MLQQEYWIAAVTQFIASLGYPNNIINDTKTNSVEAANELNALRHKCEKATDWV